jgi:hypothetical protein
MAYRLPTFNLMCRIRRWVAGPYPVGGPVAGSVTSTCQLTYARHPGQQAPAGFTVPRMILKVPAHTDIRMVGVGNGVANPDLVEVPLGSGLWYAVYAVMDVAKGFPNEYRSADLSAQSGIANLWVYPIP